MDIYGLVLVFLGIIAICMGAYELSKKTVVGRNISASTPEQIREFSRIDGICYVIEGAAAILLAFSEQIPFLSGDAGKIALVLIIVITMITNFVLARKTLNNFPKEEKERKEKK